MTREVELVPVEAKLKLHAAADAALAQPRRTLLERLAQGTLRPGSVTDDEAKYWSEHATDEALNSLGEGQTATLEEPAAGGGPPTLRVVPVSQFVGYCVLLFCAALSLDRLVPAGRGMLDAPPLGSAEAEAVVAAAAEACLFVCFSCFRPLTRMRFLGGRRSWPHVVRL